MAEVAFAWGAPALTDANDSDDYTLGVEFQMDDAYQILGVQWRVPDTLPSGTCAIGLWNATTTALLAAKDITPDPGDAGQLVSYYFDTPYSGAGSTLYVASIYTPDRYTATTNYGWPQTDGHLTASEANGWLSGSAAFPGGQSGNGANFHVSPIVEVPDPPPATDTPAGSTPGVAGRRTSAGTVAARASTGSVSARRTSSPEVSHG